MATTPAPQLSPDGKFYWDGTRWVPMPTAETVVPASPSKAVPNRLAGGIVIAGGAIAVVGCFLPWISASALFMSISRDGISSPDGQIIAVIAALSTLFGVLMLARRVAFVVPVVLLLLAAVAMWALVVDYQDLSGRVQNATSNTTVTIVAQVGAGIYATGLGIVIWAIGAMTGFRRQA